MQVEEILGEGQEEGEADLIFALKIIHEKSWERNWENSIACLDLEKHSTDVLDKNCGKHWRVKNMIFYKHSLEQQKAYMTIVNAE